MAHAPQDDAKRLEFRLALVHWEVVRRSEARLDGRRESLQLRPAEIARALRLVRRPQNFDIDWAVACRVGWGVRGSALMMGRWSAASHGVGLMFAD